MLVVTANWAIPDGSVSAPPPRGAFRQFIADACRAAVRAGFRRDGRYLPLERVVIVLAGDTFDGLVSDRWLGAVRPWERRREAAARHAEVFHAAWAYARRPFGAVARLARRGISVPSAGRHGRPVQSACVTVPVHVVLLAGDRDAALERLARAVPSGRFGIAVGNAWDDDAVGVFHGAASDPLAIRDTGPTVLESLAVDLLARFGAALLVRPVLRESGRRLTRALSAGRPLDMPLRLRSALAREALGDADAAWVIDTWRRSVDRWVREAQRWGCTTDPGAVDAIARWMHGVEPGPPPGTALEQVITDLATPLPIGYGRAMTVAGHPGPDGGGDDPRVVCLGPPPVRPAAAFRPVGPGAVSCVEAGPAGGPTSPPAVAVFETGEGGGRTLEWLSLNDAGRIGPARHGAMPILDAA